MWSQVIPLRCVCVCLLDFFWCVTVLQCAIVSLQWEHGLIVYLTRYTRRQEIWIGQSKWDHKISNCRGRIYISSFNAGAHVYHPLTKPFSLLHSPSCPWGKEISHNDLLELKAACLQGHSASNELIYLALITNSQLGLCAPLTHSTNRAALISGSHSTALLPLHAKVCWVGRIFNELPIKLQFKAPLFCSGAFICVRLKRHGTISYLYWYFCQRVRSVFQISLSNGGLHNKGRFIKCHSWHYFPCERVEEPRLINPSPKKLKLVL